MRADIHDGPEQMLQSKAGYIDARPLTASSAKPLATRGRTIHWVKLRRTQCEQMSSELPLKADIAQHSRHASNVPTPDMPCYSITSSARVSSVGGTMMPSAFAVFKLITSSYLVGCSTGRSAGFAPLKILLTKNADRRYRSRRSAP